MNKYMEIAINEAKFGIKNNHGGPFGAVIVYKEQILAQAHNEVILKNDPTSHAEINAIRKASTVLNNFSLAGCDIYTTCEPCPMCLSAILWARIDNIFFGCSKKDAENIGFDDSMFYSILSSNNIKKSVKYNQINRNTCLKIFDYWNNSENKTNY